MFGHDHLHGIVAALLPESGFAQAGFAGRIVVAGGGRVIRVKGDGRCQYRGVSLINEVPP